MFGIFLNIFYSVNTVHWSNRKGDLSWNLLYQSIMYINRLFYVEYVTNCDIYL